MPKGNSFIIELTYQRKEKKDPILLDRTEALCIDLGVNNFATIVLPKPGLKPILVKAGMLKTINQWYNKRSAQLRSKNHKRHPASVSFKRQRRIDDGIHKLNRLIIDYCAAHNIGRIIIGKNTSWKQSANIGKRNNQNFVFLPHNKLIEQLRYKGEEFGIKVTEVSEDFTSKASSLDLDPIPEYGRDANEACKFSGKRIKRGLYETKKGKQINADVNGAINIGRKKLGDEWLQRLLELDEGVFVNTPTVLRTPKGARRLLETEACLGGTVG